jgi:hypothetical protein
LKIRVVAKGPVTARGKDGSKSLRNRENRIMADTWRGVILHKAKQSSQQRPSWSGPGGPSKEFGLILWDPSTQWPDIGGFKQGSLMV